MFTSTLFIFAFFAITFWLTVELINYLWIGGQPMFPTDIIVKLIRLPFLPIKITRKVLHVLFFPFKTVLHTFLK